MGSHTDRGPTCQTLRPQNLLDGTTCRSQSPSRNVLGQASDAGEKFDIEVKKASQHLGYSIDALLMGFVGDPTTTVIQIDPNYVQKSYKHPIDGKTRTLEYPNRIRDWRIYNRNIVSQVLLQKQFWKDVFNDYRKQYLNYQVSTDISKKGPEKPKLKIADRKSLKLVLLDQGRKGIMRTAAGVQLKEAFTGLVSTYHEETVQLWDSGDLYILVPILTVSTAGVAFVGMIDMAQRTKDDNLALLPKLIYDGVFNNVYHAGDFVIHNNGLRWSPSKGSWKVDWSVSTQWKVYEGLSLKPTVSLIASDSTWKTKNGIGGKGRIELIKKIKTPLFNTASAYGEFLSGSEQRVGAEFGREFEVFGNNMHFSVGLAGSTQRRDRELLLKLEIDTD